MQQAVDTVLRAEWFEAGGQVTNLLDTAGGADLLSQAKRLVSHLCGLGDVSLSEQALCLVAEEHCLGLVSRLGQQLDSLADLVVRADRLPKIDQASARIYRQVGLYVATYWCLSALRLCRVE
ncbi:hypothetical protein [Streptomyces sp. NPDC088775]|uniref:hypothetical protein n=1 Tax=Streptomyces sp. NPDC088775 TaxID=3365896 RepID=UPI0037FE37DD